MPFANHLKSYQDLITPHEETRAGFLKLALEKNNQATPIVEEAKVLKVLASAAETPGDLLSIPEIESSLLTAAGVSDKAKKHFQNKDHRCAISDLIENFLLPAGESFVDELVFRFLLTKGDSLGGKMRNLGGKMGEWKFTRFLISSLSVRGIPFQRFDTTQKRWIDGENNSALEKNTKGLSWLVNEKARTLVYNLLVPTVSKNVDLCLLDCPPSEISRNRDQPSVQDDPQKYLALGELKGGIDPAGADEHWKTANTALDRIRTGFTLAKCNPRTFFVGAAIESAMAKEIYNQLHTNTLSNAANLTNQLQVVSLCSWLSSF